MKYNGLLDKNTINRASIEAKPQLGSIDSFSQIKQVTQAAIGAGIGLSQQQFNKVGNSVLRLSPP